MPLKSKEPADKNEAEYNCSVYFFYNKPLNKQQYCIRLETVKLFSALNYELSVGVKKHKRSIDVKLLGLSAAHTYLTEVKPAHTEVYLDDLYGDITVNVIKQDGRTNGCIFNFNIFKREIKLLEEISGEGKKFCNFTVDQERFTFGKEG